MKHSDNKLRLVLIVCQVYIATDSVLQYKLTCKTSLSKQLHFPLTAIYVTINVYLMGNEQITSNGYNLSIYFPNALHQNNYIIKHINIYTLNWLSGASSMFESPSQQAPDSRNRRRDRSVCTGRYANNTVEVQPVSYALPNCPGPAKWEKHHKTTFLS